MTLSSHNPALVPPGPSVTPVAPVGAPGRPGSATRRTTDGPSFAGVLEQQSTSAVNFSGHALARLQRRGISIDPATAQRLGSGVDRAAAKGSRSAVVFVDQTAFVVGVPSRTVITAVDREHMREQVFTNIDAAVIALASAPHGAPRPFTYHPAGPHDGEAQT